MSTEVRYCGIVGCNALKQSVSSHQLMTHGGLRKRR